MTLTVRQLSQLDPASGLGRRWEELASTNPASGVMQSLHWAAFKRRQGLAVLHLGLFEGADLIGGALCYAAAYSRGADLLVAPEGPVLPWEDAALARTGLRLLLEAAERVAPGALALRIEPHLAPPRPRLLRSFRRAPLDLLPIETLYLDLDLPPEQLLAQMRPKGRYNIGLAARRGVTVREDRTPAAWRSLAAVLTEVGLRDGFFVEPATFFENLTGALTPPGLARCLFAEHGGEILGALLLICYGERATYLYGGVSNRRRELMAGYALQWAAIQTARGAGCRTYDFYGYEPYGAPEHLYAGFSRFKRQFGGQPQRFIGAHDTFFLDRLAEAVVRVTHETGIA
jgi:lipid II:glycine glycyltransferase (peptidoglycan interpeptide bridge formation enzyme)